MSIFFFHFFSAGEASARLFHQPVELGARKLRLPTEQDPQVQCSPGVTIARELQVPAADVVQGAGEFAESVLRQLPERLVRQE